MLPSPAVSKETPREFGLRFLASPAQLNDAYPALLNDQLAPLIDQGLAAAIYTQLADVEIELNGYLTYDRSVPKMAERRIGKAHRALFRRSFGRARPAKRLRFTGGS